MPNTRSLKRRCGSHKNRVSRKLVKRLRKSRQCRAGRQRVLSRKVKQRKRIGGTNSHSRSKSATKRSINIKPMDGDEIHINDFTENGKVYDLKQKIRQQVGHVYFHLLKTGSEEPLQNTDTIPTNENELFLINYQPPIQTLLAIRKNSDLLQTEWVKLTEDTDINSLPEEIKERVTVVEGHITELKLNECHLTALPDLSALQNLEKLNCFDNELTALPDLSALVKLTELDCSYNKLTALPENLEALQNLEKLDCHKNQLRALPDLSALGNLETLHCDQNQLTGLPDMSALVNLETLDCSKNQLNALPDLSALGNLIYVCCSDNQLTEVEKKKLDNLNIHIVEFEPQNESSS